VGLDAGEDGGVALVQEAAGAADLRRRVALLDELLRELLGVRVGGDDHDELELSVFHAAPSKTRPPAASSESYARSIEAVKRVGALLRCDSAPGDGRQVPVGGGATRAGEQ